MLILTLLTLWQNTHTHKSSFQMQRKQFHRILQIRKKTLLLDTLFMSSIADSPGLTITILPRLLLKGGQNLSVTS